MTFYLRCISPLSSPLYRHHHISLSLSHWSLNIYLYRSSTSSGWKFERKFLVYHVLSQHNPSYQLLTTVFFSLKPRPSSHVPLNIPSPVSLSNLTNYRLSVVPLLVQTMVVYPGGISREGLRRKKLKFIQFPSIRYSEYSMCICVKLGKLFQTFLARIITSLKNGRILSFDHQLSLLVSILEQITRVKSDLPFRMTEFSPPLFVILLRHGHLLHRPTRYNSIKSFDPICHRSRYETPLSFLFAYIIRLCILTN